MRTTIVPAQITSVEDKIAGNLSFAQLMLLIIPLFLSVAMYILLPPFGGFHVYKIVIAGVATALCLLLAIRFRGKLIAQWLGIRVRYNLRPRYYVFNKNDMHGRKQETQEQEEIEANVEQAKKQVQVPILASHQEIVRFEEAVGNPRLNLGYFVDKKGNLSVNFNKTD